MQDKSVLLNSGRSHDVVPSRTARAFLSRTFESDSRQSTMVTLRSGRDSRGRQRVDVFIKDKLVGHLNVDSAAGLLTTIEDCEAKRKTPRARGTVLVPSKSSGKLHITVNLADADHLLTAPQESNDDTSHRESSVSVSDAPRSPQDSLATTPMMDHTDEDIPDFPEPQPKPVELRQDPAPTQASAPIMEPPVAPAPPEAAPPEAPPEPKPPIKASPMEAPPADNRSVEPTPVEPTPVESPPARIPRLDPRKNEPLPRRVPPKTEPATSAKPSLEGLLSTRAAWTPDLATLKQEPQPGWLAYSAQTEGQSSSPMEKTDRSGSGGDMSIQSTPAWSYSPRPPQPAAEATRAKKSHGGAGWIVPILVLLAVMGAIGFAVWKTVLGPQTFVEPDYGYSFSRPGSWEQVADDALPPQFAYVAQIGRGREMVAFEEPPGSDASPGTAVVAVARGADSPLSQAQIPTQMQLDVYRAQNVGMSVSIIEPAYSTTIGGLDAWRMTVSVASGSYSTTMAYCLLVYENTSYALMAASTDSAWTANRSSFERFIESFKAD